MRRNSMVFHYITSGLVVIVTSYTVLAFLLFMLVSQYFYDDKSEALKENASRIAGLVSTAMEIIPGGRRELFQMIELASLNTEASIIVVDVAGNSVYYTESDYMTGEELQLPLLPVQTVLKGEKYSDIGDFSGVFNKSMFVSGVPITGSDGSILGAVFLASVATGYSELMTGIMRIFLFSAVIVMTMTTAVNVLTAAQLVKPLNQMMVAVKEYSKGNFDHRMEMDGPLEIVELATAFNNMAYSLDNLERMRRGFITNVSHDLRTPMTSIGGFVDGILDGTIPPDEEGRYLAIVSDEIKRLTRLVHTLLDVAGIEASKEDLNPQPFDICEVAQEVLFTFEKKIEAKGLDVVFDFAEEYIEAFGEQDSIYRALYNLVDNAVKYSYDGGLLKISIEKKGKKVSVSVYNEGVGISAEDLPFVFERFYKTDKSRGLDRTSMGLGLYITKTFIEKNEGTISVTSTQGQYCRFTFVIPAM